MMSMECQSRLDLGHWSRVSVMALVHTWSSFYLVQIMLLKNVNVLKQLSKIYIVFSSIDHYATLTKNNQTNIKVGLVAVKGL